MARRRRSRGKKVYRAKRRGPSRSRAGGQRIGFRM